MIVTDISKLAVTTNVLNLAKVKEILKTIDLADIPLVDEVDTISNMILLEMLSDQDKFNKLLEAILDTPNHIQIDFESDELSASNYLASVKKLSFFLSNLGKPILTYVKILIKESNVQKNMVINQMETMMRKKLNLIDQKVNDLISLDIPITIEQ